MALFVAFAAACASPMKQPDCAKADWYTLGFEDGRKGAPETAYSDYQAQCERYAVTPNPAAYHTGRLEGLALYCTPENGLRVGREGETYHGVCPKDVEPAFKKRYDFGQRFYQLNTQISARLSEVRNTEPMLLQLRMLSNTTVMGVLSISLYWSTDKRSSSLFFNFLIKKTLRSLRTLRTLRTLRLNLEILLNCFSANGHCHAACTATSTGQF